MTIPADIRQQIDKRLAHIESQFGVEVFYACESGSRAWDFASADSDYDVRFLYLHSRDWYLSLIEQRDVIETPIEGVYDVNGWDLRKALRLAGRSNPVLFEWMSSPIRYVERPLSVEFRETILAAFDPVKAYCHYLSMAKGQRRTYLTGETVRQKKYFYAVRPLLACLFLLDHRGPVPMRFFDLVDATSIPVDVQQVLGDLLRNKRLANEKSEAQRLPVLDSWIDKTLETLRTSLPAAVPPFDMAQLDRFFRRAIAG
ncbi:MAG: nucleotidyltransferase domain-containing protein [Rhodospirillales bacterium]|nr:nucleotidyltransferase domain-containing protein [Rhodospirillales bacterium]